MRFRFLINYFEGKKFLFLVLLETFSELSCRKVFILKVINTTTSGCAGQQLSLPTVQFIYWVYSCSCIVVTDWNAAFRIWIRCLDLDFSDQKKIKDSDPAQVFNNCTQTDNVTPGCCAGWWSSGRSQSCSPWLTWWWRVIDVNITTCCTSFCGPQPALWPRRCEAKNASSLCKGQCQGCWENLVYF